MDKKYLVSVLIYLVTGILALSLIVFVIYHLAGFDETNFTTAVASSAEAQSGFEGDGWIFRNERVIEPTEEGAVYSPLRDGENVAAGAEVCAVYAENEETLARLRYTDAFLEILEKANTGTTVAALKDCTAKVRALSKELRANAQNGNSAAMLQKAADIEIALDRRNAASGAVPNYDHEIAALKEERTLLLASLGEKKEALTTPVAGNYRKTCDGYEKYFDFGAADTLDPASFKLLTDYAGQPESYPAGKLESGSVWKLLIVTDTENTVLLAAGKTHTAQFDNGLNMTMTLDRISTDPTSGQTLLVFSSRITPSVPLSRRTHVKIVTSSRSGLRVPASAVRCPAEENGQIGVYVQNGNRISFKKIEILTKQDGFYVVKAFPKTDAEHADYLRENDIVLTSGKELTEGYAR